MFSVSGVDGQIFHGMLEDLLRTSGMALARRVDRTHESAAVATSGGRDVPATDVARYQMAAAAYAQAVARDSSRARIHHAYQVMTRGVATVRTDTPVEEAWRTLAQRDVAQAPVLDTRHHLVGLVSREHLLRVLNEDEGKLRDVLPRTVQDVMVSPVVAADPVTDVRRIARVMLEYALPAVPVVDDSGWLIGIVAHQDILRVVAADPPLTLWA